MFIRRRHCGQHWPCIFNPVKQKHSFYAHFWDEETEMWRDYIPESSSEGLWWQLLALGVAGSGAHILSLLYSTRWLEPLRYPPGVCHPLWEPRTGFLGSWLLTLCPSIILGSILFCHRKQILAPLQDSKGSCRALLWLPHRPLQRSFKESDFESTLWKASLPSEWSSRGLARHRGHAYHRGHLAVLLTDSLGAGTSSQPR